MKPALAMVLAGGRGKRMDILCHVRPKPTLPFAGRFRIIDFSLSNCVYSQIQNVAILTDYQRSQMAEYLRSWYLNNPGQHKLHVLEPRVGSYKGTADAIYQNIDYLKETDSDVVLVLAGDHIYKMDYHRMLAFHERVKADVTIGVIPIPVEEVYRFGIVTVDPGGKVVNFVEKPKFPQSNLASMGIYVFNKEIMCERLTDDAVLADSLHDFGYSILPEMVKRDKVFAYQFKDYWRDIGTTAAYYKANMEIISQPVCFSLDESQPILTGRNIPKQPEELEIGNVVNSIVSPDCIIRGRVENSILSPGVYVSSGAVVRNSVLMSNVSIGYHSIVDQCILDEQVNIGEFCYIGLGSRLLPRERDITILGKGVVVPAYTAIGHRCKVFPHAGPDDFTTSVVPPGSIVPRRPPSGNISNLKRVGVK
jgi:glucose-1-phosphate adenylyltransferase